MIDMVKNDNIKIVSKKSGGVLLEKEGQKVILLKGSPYEIGYQHGALLKDEITKITNILYEGAQDAKPGVLYDIWEQAKSFIPERYIEELKGLADGAGLSLEKVQLANVFPELFHCSGIALFGEASATRELLHGRILDYTVDAGFQDYSVVILSKPNGYNCFLNASFAGIIGSVTGINDQQIAVGEKGGGGEGNWTGVPMTFLMRMALEEADDLEQAVSIFRDNKRTCEYYYVISDGKIPDARVMKCTPEEMIVLGPGEDHPILPVEPLKDVVMISRDERFVALREAVHKNYGKVDKDLLIEIMKRPVSMKSNLHNAIFLPQKLKMWLAVAKNPDDMEDFQACYQTYYEYDMNELMAYF